MRVSEQFIASLLARINLVELISKKITLRQAGANFIGLCPFHQEKTPSFTVNQNKQFFHCFGCKESGDAIRFFMLIEHKGFLESVEDLANQYGLYLEKEPVSHPDPLIEKAHKILNVAADFYHQELFKSNPQAIAALNYLIDRGLNLTTIRHFNLGFANSGWTNLIDFCEQQATAKVLELEKNIDIKTTLNQAGLIIEKNCKFYDRFRARIMLPICNKFGKVVAFGARVINLEQTPKYLNSPETIVFSKQKELYGLDKIKNKLKNFTSLIVVEGYIDVLTLFQAEIYNVVATLGTALNEYHIRTIINIVPEIIFCFDGDLAGNKAAIRAMNFAINMIGAGILNNNHIVRFVSLPKSYDPDLLVKEKGATEFKKIVLEAKVLSDFFFEYLLKKYPDNNIESLNKLAEEAKSQINKLPNNLLQDLWYEKLAGILGIQSDILKPKSNSAKVSTIQNHGYNNSNYYNKKESARSYAKKSLTYNNNNISNHKYPVSNATKALAMLLLDNNLLSLCSNLCSKLDNNDLCIVNLPPDIDLFIKIVRILQDLKNSKIITDNKQQVDIEKLMPYLETVYAQRLLLLESKKIVQFIPFAGMEQEFLGAVKRIDRVLIENTVDELLTISKQRNLEAKEKLLLQQLLQDCC
jgi:DNA primase